MPKEEPLYKSLKQLSTDILKLKELAAQEAEISWEGMIETVKREIDDELSRLKCVTEADMAFRNLVVEIYDNLNMLILSLKDSQEKLHRLATRDLLTGLYNRNYFNETIVHDIQKAARYHERLSFLLLDIDRFKMINDTFGHLHGDGVIKECALMLKKSVRKSDFLCRFGGDEFVIVTPMPTCQDNNPLINRIRAALEDWNSKFSTLDYSLSMSIGCALWTEGRDIMDVLHEADTNMYLDKQRKS